MINLLLCSYSNQKRGIAKDSSPKQNIYTAIADFKNTQGDGINLKKSEVLKVLEKTETGWWLVRGDQGEGWAPSSYIHKDVVQEVYILFL